MAELQTDSYNSSVFNFNCYGLHLIKAKFYFSENQVVTYKFKHICGKFIGRKKSGGKR